MSSTSQINLWGRAWNLTVKTQSSDQSAPTEQVLSSSAWDPESLRVTFDVLQAANTSPLWYAEVKVYNLNDESLYNNLWNAKWLTLQAGYQTGPQKYTTIWDGPVLQVMFDRENVTDLVMIFNCVSTLPFLEQAFFNRAEGMKRTQYQAISDMIAQISGNVNDQVSDHATELLQSKNYLRGKTFFGSINKYIEDIANDNNLAHWKERTQPFISELGLGQINPQYTYSPPFAPGTRNPKPQANVSYSIIDVPRQTPFGAIFTVLLDPRLVVQVPPLIVKLDRTVVRQFKIQIGELPPLSFLDKDEIYIAAQVRHVGDTRGNAWYSEVTGYYPAWAQQILDGLFTAAQQAASP